MRDDYRSLDDIDNTAEARFIWITRLIKGVAVIRGILKRETMELQRRIYILDRAFVRSDALNDVPTISPAQLSVDIARCFCS